MAHTYTNDRKEHRMSLKEITLTEDDIEFIENLLEERQEALDKKKRMPNLARASAQHEIDSLRKAIGTQELF
jgi:5-bromo-4-chloroindolyl phosphate hydrolysis protein